MSKFLLVFFLILFTGMHHFIQAEVVILLSGKSWRGKILKKNDRSITLQVRNRGGTMKMKFPLSKIHAIKNGAEITIITSRKNMPAGKQKVLLSPKGNLAQKNKKENQLAGKKPSSVG